MDAVDYTSMLEVFDYVHNAIVKKYTIGAYKDKQNSNPFIQVAQELLDISAEIQRMRNLLRIRACACGWTGREFQTLDYKHPIGARMCPECHEPTEILQEEGEE